MSEFKDIETGIGSGIGTVSFVRANANNTVRPQTLREICDALDILTADEAVKAIVLRGDGQHFSAGADFGFLEELTATPAAQIKSTIYTHFQGAAKRLYRCPKPTVALVQGAAVTVGCELALACDFRIAAEDAMFQESWINLGIMPPLGGTFLLPRIIGLARAKEMCLRARRVKAAEALEIGLVSEVVANDALDERGRELAGELAAIAPLGYAAIKEALHRGLETGMEAEWTANVANQAILIDSEDFGEGLDAVKARRKPEFKGR